MTPTKQTCGICGSEKKKLIKTQCCNNWICDDYNNYELFSYKRNSCYRNHDRYTLCSSHYHEEHKGSWQDCRKCRENFEPEMLAWYGTNEYNFEKLKDVPLFKPKRCEICGKGIFISQESYTAFGDKVWCVKCKPTII